MIDTDKYEGHSMGWSLDDPDDWAWAMNMFTAAGKTNEADAQLIADAPLLLAEVERLRELNDDLDCDLQGFQEAAKEDEAALKDLVDSLEGIEEELKAEVERLREELALYEKYVICHPDGTHCCDECLERNGSEVMKNEHR